MRRRLLVPLAAVTLALAVAAPASAFHCFVVKKPAGAGSAGTATFDVLTNTFTPGSSLSFNAAGQLQGGGFVTLTVVAGPTVLATADVFGHIDLPEGAHASGPGTPTECNGVGIDDLIACILAAP